MPRKLPNTRTIAAVWRAIADENIASLPRVVPAELEYGVWPVEGVEGIALRTGLCMLLRQLRNAGAITREEWGDMTDQLAEMFYDPDGKSGSDHAYFWPPVLDKFCYPEIDPRGVRYTAAGLLALYADGEIVL